MEKINYEFQATPTIEVNGHIFELQASEADVFERALRMRALYGTIGKKTPLAKIMNAVTACGGVVDEILGDGAMKVITGGKPIRLSEAVEVMILIAQAASKSYAKRLEDYE